MSLNPEFPAMIVKLHVTVSRCSLDVETKLVGNLETNRNVYFICSSTCQQWVVKLVLLPPWIRVEAGLLYSSAKAPAGYPSKNSSNRKKIESARGRWSSLFPLPIMPRALLFFLPSLPTTRRRLCGGERLGYVPEYTRKKNSRKRNQIFSISFSTQNIVKKSSFTI